VGAKAKAIERYKLWYSSLNRTRNGVGILANRELMEQVVKLRYKSDCIMSIKLVVGEEIINVECVYAP